MGINKIDRKVPCYECAKRYNGCHSSCAEYKAYSDEKAARAKIIREGKAREGMMDEVRFSTIQKVSGKKRKITAWKG